MGAFRSALGFVIFMMGFVVSWIWFHRFRGRFHTHTGSFRSSVVRGCTGFVAVNPGTGLEHVAAP